MLSRGIISIKRITLTELIGWLPVLFYLSNLFRMTGHSAAPYILTAVAASVPGLYKALLNRGMAWKPAIITTGLFLLTGYCNCLFIGNLTPMDVALEVLFTGIAFTMLLYPSTFFQGMTCFYLTAAFFLLCYATGRNTLLILESSRNYISVLLILSCAFYYCTLEDSNRVMGMIDLLPAMICFFLSIWAYGRGGILSCAVLLMLVGLCWLVNYSDGDNRKKALVMGLILIMACAIILTNINIIDSFMSLGKWGQKGASGSDRFNIWGAYFSEAGESFLYTLFGAPLEQIPIIYGFGGNTHNSFVQLHAFNGLIAFVLFIIASTAAFFREIKNKQYLHATFLTVMLLRGMTDKFVFGQYGMPVMLYLILYPYFKSTMVKKLKQEMEVCHA